MRGLLPYKIANMDDVSKKQLTVVNAAQRPVLPLKEPLGEMVCPQCCMSSPESQNAKGADEVPTGVSAGLPS